MSSGATDVPGLAPSTVKTVNDSVSLLEGPLRGQHKEQFTRVYTSCNYCHFIN